MWFKQLKLYQIENIIGDSMDAFVEQLQPFTFKPCLPSLPYSYGWTSPYDQAETPLVHFAHHCFFFALQFEEKILPNVVVNQELTAQVKEIETQRERKISAKEKTALKEQVTQTLLPRAFSKFSKVYACIDTKNQWLALNTTNANKLEKFQELFKRSLPGINLSAFGNKQIIHTLTNWVIKNQLPQQLVVEERLVLKDPNNRSRSVRCRHQDHISLPLEQLIKQGFRIYHLGLNWADQFNFTLNEDLTLTNLDFADEIIASLKDENNESPEQRFAADFYLTVTTLNSLIKLILNLKVNTKL